MLVGAVVSIWLFSNQTQYVGMVPTAVPEIGDITFEVGFVLAFAIYAVLFKPLAGPITFAAAGESGDRRRHRAGLNAPMGSVPTIDLDPWFDGSPDGPAGGRRRSSIGALQSVGFFLLTGHGVTRELGHGCGERRGNSSRCRPRSSRRTR